MSDAGEIIKSGAFDKLADIVHKLAGPMAEEVGLLMADKIKVYRIKNWLNVVKKTEKILEEANLSPDAVPPRIFLPILEASSVEDDETLQNLWAGLLASASEKSDSLSPSFTETLKQLTPSEAKALSSFFAFAQTQSDFRLLSPGSIHLLFPPEMSDVTFRLITETFERLGLIRRQFDLQPRKKSFFGLAPALRGGKAFVPSILFGTSEDEDRLPELTYEFEFTEYGVQFMKACRGPKKAGAQSV